MANDEKCLRFERLIMPHLDAAYNLARWLLRNDADAEEAVQEAYLRAYRYFDGFRGDDGRAWLLAIVRNSCYTQHGRLPGPGASEEFDELVHTMDTDHAGGNGRVSRDPEALAIAQADCDRVNRAIEGLPLAFREVLVMREIEGLSYKEIAKIIDIPLGTVMSRLARGRHLLQVSLSATERHDELKALRDTETRSLVFHAAPAALRQRIAENLHTGEKPAFTKRLRAWQAATAASILVTALAAWVALPSLTHAPAQTAARSGEKMVYHIASSAEAQNALRNVSNHLSVSPQAKVIVVAHNQGVNFLLRGAKDSAGKTYEAAVLQLVSRGVEFRICQNTLTRLDIDADAVIPEARLVPSGIAEISRLQTQEGYAYMRL